MRKTRFVLSVLGPFVALATFIACSSDSTPTGAGGPGSGDGGPNGGDATTNADGAVLTDGGTSISDGATGDPDGGDAAPGYSVTSIPGVVLWLESEKGVNRNPPAMQWDDLSGNGNHAVRPQASCGLPDFNASSQNGHAAIGFHEYECLQIADAPSLQWGTGDFLVATVAQNNFNKPTGTGTTFTYQDGSYLRKRYGEVYSKIASAFGPGPTIVYNDWRDQTWAIVGAVDYTEMLRTSYSDPAHLIVLRRSGSVLEFRIDGVSISSLTDAGAPIDISNVGTPVAIGGRPNLTNYVGSIWEIVAVKGAISDPDLAAFEGYAKAKYGL